jgi:hypothetical protein
LMVSCFLFTSFSTLSNELIFCLSFILLDWVLWNFHFYRCNVNVFSSSPKYQSSVCNLSRVCSHFFVSSVLSLTTASYWILSGQTVCLINSWKFSANWLCFIYNLWDVCVIYLKLIIQ